MIHYLRRGDLPPKHHVTHYVEGRLLMEHCVTRRGFDGGYSILYYPTPPTNEGEVAPTEVPGYAPVRPVAKQPTARRHLRTGDLPPGGDFLTGRRVLLLNGDVRIGVCKPDRPPEAWFVNADGDECWFACQGGGNLESVYGVLPFRRYDYLLIPKGTPYRLLPEGGRGTFLFFESATYIDVPAQFRNPAGQLTMDAPYCHRDFRVPGELIRYDPGRHGKPPFRVVVKEGGELTVHLFPHFPWEVVGWDGTVYPVAFNILDYQPKTGAIHLPPTSHITFAGRGFILCSFVPRKVDYYERGGTKAVPCPYGHWSVDCDEILYYVEGDFTSRKGIGPESLSLHPRGIPHGPHPGRYAGSIGRDRTDELAVMCDTFAPLRLTEAGAAVEDREYHVSWAKGG